MIEFLLDNITANYVSHMSRWNKAEDAVTEHILVTSAIYDRLVILAQRQGIVIDNVIFRLISNYREKIAREKREWLEKNQN